MLHRVRDTIYWRKNSAADIAADDIAEQVPGLALEFHQLKLGDRGEVSGAGINFDARQQEAELQTFDAGRLLHDVLAREIVAAGLQHMHEALCDGVAVYHVAIYPVAFREILDEEFVEGLHAGVILPLRIGRILQIGGRDDGLRILKTDRLHHGADRGTDVVKKVQRLPANLVHLLDRLRREFRRGDIEEHIGVQRLQLDDVRIDGRLRDLEAFLDDDHRGGLGAETILQAFDIVLTVIVVLVEYGDLGVGHFLQNVLRINPGFALVVGLPAHGPWKILGVIPLGGAGGDEQLRHLLGIHVLLDGRVRRRAQRVEDEQNLVALDQLARLLDRLRRAVAIVVADEVDLAAVDAAFGVDLLEVGIFGLADHAVGGGRAAVGRDVADLDFGVGGAGVVFLLRERAAAGYGEQSDGGRKGPQSQLDSRHVGLPGSRLNVSCF